MRWGIALLVLIAACGSDTPGMRLEILAGDTTAARIELYIATRACNGCSGNLSPKGVTGKLAGNVWLLDGNAMTGTPNTAATLEGGSYTYNLQAPDTGKDVQVAYIVVVGYDAAGKAVGFAELKNMMIYAGSAEWYRVTLGPVTEQASSDNTAPAGDRIHVWRRSDTALAACVGVEHADASGVQRIWLVPEDDTDCDAIDLECDEYAHAAMGTAHIDDASCITDQTKIANAATSTCLLGGPACIDGRGNDLTCGPVFPHYCLPDAVCAIPGCRTDFGNCVRDGVNVPRIKCDIPSNSQTGGRCNGGDPSAVTGFVRLHQLVAKPGMPNVPATSCTSLQFVEPKFADPSPSPTIIGNGVVLTHGPLMPPCEFSLTFATGAVVQMNLPIFSVVDLGLANGNHMLLPIEIKFTPGTCSQVAAFCGVTIGDGDGVTHCAQE